MSVATYQPTIKPIPTRYDGCVFRSRLEARWAVFFDYLPTRWEYEVQGFAFNDKAYLPDFYLPDFDLWAEVKPSNGFSDEVFDLLNHFVRESGFQVICLEGTPSFHSTICLIDGVPPRRRIVDLVLLEMWAGFQIGRFEAAVEAARSARFST